MAETSAPLDVDRLRLLREVGLRGSIAAAARSVGVTASAVSQQLAQLEREAGTSLLDRSPRGVVLTGAGQLLADRAGQVLDLLASTRADLDRVAGSLGGPVRVASVASAAATLVSAAVTRLRDTAPGIAVSVRVAEPERGIGMLLSGDVDVAIVDEYDHVPVALPDTAVATPLLTEPLVVLAPAGFGRRQVALDTLAGADWVMPPEDAACGRAVRAACRTAGFEPRVRWETDDMLLLVRAVADGHGVAVLPRLSVVAGLAGGVTPTGVDVGRLRGPGLSRRVLAVARRGAAERPVVQVVLETLEWSRKR